MSLQTTQEQRDRSQKQIAEKMAAKTKKEKWMNILSSAGTIAAAGGLSLINPLAIPVAINSTIALLNAIFSKSKAPAEANEVLAIQESNQQI